MLPAKPGDMLLLKWRSSGEPIILTVSEINKEKFTYVEFASGPQIYSSNTSSLNAWIEQGMVEIVKCHP